MNTWIRSEIFFSGRVQGVGFRWSTYRLAMEHPEVRGTVRNLADGRVELICEGPVGAVEAFVGALKALRNGYIEEIEERLVDVCEGLEGFEIIG